MILREETLARHDASRPNVAGGSVAMRDGRGQTPSRDGSAPRAGCAINGDELKIGSTARRGRERLSHTRDHHLSEERDCVRIYMVYTCLSAVFFAYYVWYNPLYYIIGSDMQYYLSIADSVFNGSGMRDMTTDPTRGIVTPQNGIVFLHLGLMAIGIIDPERRFLALMIINYAALLCSLVLLRNIFASFNLAPRVVAFFLGVILFTNIIFKTLLHPINDGLFFCLSLLLVRLIIANHAAHRRQRDALILIVGCLIPHFRNQGVLILLSACVAYLIVRDYKRSGFYLASCLLSYLSVQLLYTLYATDYSGMKSAIVYAAQTYSFRHSVVALFAFISSIFLGIPQLACLPTLGCHEYLWSAFPLSVVLLLSLARVSIHSVKERDFNRLFLAAYILATLALTLLLPWTFRYILPVFPFMFLFLAFQYGNTRIFAGALRLYLVYAICLSVLKVTYFDLYYLRNQDASRTLLPRLPEQYALLSISPRHSYFLLRKRTSVDPASLRGARDVLIFGDQEYIDGETAKLEAAYVVREKLTYDVSWRLERTEGEVRVAHLKL